VTFQLSEAGTSAYREVKLVLAQLWEREGAGHLAPVKIHSFYLLVANPWTVPQLRAQQATLALPGFLGLLGILRYNQNKKSQLIKGCRLYRKA